MKRLLLLTAITLYAIALCAQNQLRLSSRQVSTAEGLPGNTINEMVQDTEGYIWMATNNGLSRYDGYATVNYRPTGDTPGLKGRLGRITLDTAAHCLWLNSATYTNACYDLQRRAFIDWSGEPDRQFNKFMLTRQGMLFYGMSFGVRRVQQGRVTDYTKDNGSLPSNEVLQIVEDDGGNVWMPTDKGVALLTADGRLQTLLPGRPLTACATSGGTTCLLTADGEVWLSDGRGSGGAKVKPLKGAKVALPKVNTSFVWQGRWLLFAPEQVYAVDLKSGRVETMDIVNGLNQGSLPGYHFISNQSGRLWIFPDEGTMRSMPLIDNAHFSSGKGRKFHIAADAQGRLFIATYGNGLFVWEPATDRLDHFSPADEHPLIRSNYLTAILADSRGYVWIGSEGTGAYCVCPPSLIHYPLSIAHYEELLPEPGHQGDWANAVSALMQRADNSQIVVGTRWGIRYEGTTSGLSRSAKPFSSSVSALLLDSEGRLWTGTRDDGLYIDDHHYPLPSITCLCQDAKGRVWLGTHGSGLYLADAGLHFTPFLNGEINKSRIKSLKLSSAGILWIGTNDGIYSIDTRRDTIAEADFRSLHVADKPFPYKEIFDIHVEADTLLWVGAASSGLLKCRMDHDTLTALESITTHEGLPNDNVYSITTDRQGYIWTGTEGGIARVNPRNGIVRTIQANCVATEHCALTTTDGSVILGTFQGLCIIHPAAPASGAPASPVACAAAPLQPSQPQITDLRVNGISITHFHPGSRLSLPHDENHLSFYFSDFNYGPVATSLYQYWLEGADRTWQPITTDHHADYRDLGPGRYVFHLRALADNDEWQDEVTYSFTISQPWYNTWWAWLVYLFLAALIAWYVYRNWKEKFDLHQQMKIDRQLMDFRTRLFTNITHEFRTPLAIIKGAVDKLDAKQPAVQTVQRGTKRMFRLVNQFMEFRKVSTGHLRLKVQADDVVGFVKEHYQDFWAMAQQKDIQMTFTPFARDYQVPFDHEIIETIVYNLLSNAIKYTPQRGTVSVRLRRTDDQLVLSVEDSGPGISAEQQAALFQPFMNGLTSQGGMGIGLYTAHVMAGLHHGSLTYDKAPDGGARFTLTIPATDVYSPDETLNAPLGSQSLAGQDTSETRSQDPSVAYAATSLQPEPLNDLVVAIIEDDPDMMQQIRQEMGVYFRLDTYMNGLTGYEGVRANPPSLLICDVMLPDMNGYDIVSRLKSEAATRQVPVIMLTALDDERHQIRAYRAGADDYMVKPCNWHLLVARATSIIQQNLNNPAAPDSSAAGAAAPSAAGAAEASQPSQLPLIIRTSQSDKVFMDKLQMFTAQHLADETFSVDQLAQLMNMGRTKFYGRVREMTGLSPNKYLMKLRMEKAADLLADGELTVSEVSYKVGIQDPSYFNKCFKAQYGVVPSKYVRSAQ